MTSDRQPPEPHASRSLSTSWRPRPEEIRPASIGVDSEWAPLRTVALAVPGPWCRTTDPAALELMSGRPAPDDLVRDIDNLRTVFAERAIQVLDVQAISSGPNFLFLRDLWAMTPFGAVLARPAPAGRAGEERDAAWNLAALGVPVIGTVVGPGTFEGADLLWLDRRTAVVGTGLRTNDEGYDQVQGILARYGIETIRQQLQPPGQHLLGRLNFFARGGACGRRLRELPAVGSWLADNRVEVIDADEGDPAPSHWSMNFVCLGPADVVAPRTPSSLVARLRALGVAVTEVDVPALLEADGAIGCATAIVSREPV